MQVLKSVENYAKRRSSSVSCKYRESEKYNMSDKVHFFLQSSQALNNASLLLPKIPKKIASQFYFSDVRIFLVY